MPSTAEIEIDPPPEAVSIAEQYSRRERPLSAFVVLLAVSAFLATNLLTSLLPAIAVAAVSIVVARAPILQSYGTVHLRTDDDPETVVESFTGPTPPVLAFQWGLADEVETADETVTYRTSYLFGLRTAAVTVHREAETAADGTRSVELDVTANDQPWATYAVTIRAGDDHTVVDVEYESNRRFGLRRLPQQFVADRYRDDALTAQGYTVVERDSHFGL
ncbi:hypothetical protein [Halomicrobium salinisoli]|uniref:hypothetical protein n=1 Tax=Halomicrobium salinisoli TaxID=2878391 RepID=UPI001CF020EF|nr:hypothetical protein [Halomicrobium salinisoli]